VVKALIKKHFGAGFVKHNVFCAFFRELLAAADVRRLHLRPGKSEPPRVGGYGSGANRQLARATKRAARRQAPRQSLRGDYDLRDRFGILCCAQNGHGSGLTLNNLNIVL
jgi:hypothetical protein